MKAGGVPESSLGHHYQSLWALGTLISLMEASRDDPAAGIRVEHWDDVEIVSTAGVDLINTKHRTVGGALTDNSVDFWKSVRLWMVTKRLATDVTIQRLCLVTTQKARRNDGVWHLRSTNRDVNEAVERITQAAEASTNAQNEDACSKFLNLTLRERRAFLNDVYIIDDSEDISALQTRLRSTLTYVVGRKFADLALNDIIGWWTRLLIAHMKDKGVSRIAASLLDVELDRIRERFGLGVLSIDSEIYGLTAPDTLDESARLLIEQLRLVEINDDGVRFALHDYFRAYTQCARWCEDGLVQKHELTNYENKLRYEWDRYRSIHASPSRCDKKSEAELIQIGQTTLETLTSRTVSIRKGVDEPLITRGYYYALSNVGSIGWHPHFVKRLAHILNAKSA